MSARFESDDMEAMRFGGVGAQKDATNQDVSAPGWRPYCWMTCRVLLLSSRLNLLLVLTPFAFMSKQNGKEAATFVLALLALCPFAERISFVTEDVAKYTNDTLGGLLAASFGNITELIICIFALNAGYLRLVQVSMLGSVLSNLLLVLGSAFLVGGYQHKEQKFSAAAAVTNSGLLVLSMVTLVLPMILSAFPEGEDDPEPVQILGGNQTADGNSLDVDNGPVLWLSRLVM